MSLLIDNSENNSQIAGKVVVSTVFFPIEKAKTLIQLGFEPMPPYHTRSMFGKPVLGLPNIFKYASYMWRDSGWAGLYGGCTVSALYHISVSLAHRHVADSIVFQDELELRRRHSATTATATGTAKPVQSGVVPLSCSERDRLFAMSAARDLAARLAAVLVSQPLFVLKTRIVAQFVGEEQHYSGVLSGLWAIYRENGVAGLFSGLVPRLLAAALASLLVSATVYVTVSLQHSSQYTAPAASFFASTLVYPFHVVSTCMAVTGSNSLQAGRVPFMPGYGSWLDCWRDLRLRGQLKRGSSVLFRTYAGPQVFLGGKALLL